MHGVLCHSSPGFPLVTVVTVVFNGQRFIAGCLDSVLQQDYPNIEHLVFDGSSTDGTLDVLRQYDDRVAYWQSEPDKGVFDAWNKSLPLAHGDWICFLGVDDEFLPGAISKYMELAAANPQAEYLSSQLLWAHPSGYTRTMGKPWTWAGFRKRMVTAHVGSMHHRRLYERLGQYDTSYRSAADYEFLLRARHELKAAYMPVTTVRMRAGGVSDDYAAFAEATRAKISTGGRNRLLATLELYFANAKFLLRPLRRAVGKRLSAR